ncbi:MAG: DUF2384 domain-containing protein [Nitrococcus sp.]|nr:DUF2384 domain-containing protein [Nitrococcus sp.]
MLEANIVTVLGGPRALGRAVHNQLDLADLIAGGIPNCAALSLRRRLHFTEQELANSLGVSAKTLRRAAARRPARLTPAQGDRLYRLARIVAMAEEVFEDMERAYRWLREPQRGLGERVPLSLLITEAGAREVEDLLGRIEYGIFS